MRLLQEPNHGRNKRTRKCTVATLGELRSVSQRSLGSISTSIETAASALQQVMDDMRVHKNELSAVIEDVEANRDSTLNHAREEAAHIIATAEKEKGSLLEETKEQFFYTVTMDPQSWTPHSGDVVQVFGIVMGGLDGDVQRRYPIVGGQLFKRRLSNFGTMDINADQIKVSFQSDGSKQAWGFKLYIEPCIEA